MSKSDVISWFSGNTAALSAGKIISVLMLALILGTVIFFTYKLTYTGVSYSARFNCGNVLVCLLTAVIMLMIGSNIAISLGMVGALSIVRFRTALKDPQDTIYVFWAIVTGLCSGAGAYELAVISSLFIAVVLFAMSYYSASNCKYLIIVRGNASLSKEALSEKLAAEFKKAKLRAVNSRTDSVEIIAEVITKSTLVLGKTDSLKALEGVVSTNFILEA